MVIVKLWGGLGNQMFEYALWLSFRKKGIRSKLDRTFYKKIQEHNGYELEKIFGIRGIYSTRLESFFLKPISKLLYNLFNRPYKETPATTGLFIPAVNTFSFGYLKGYWQSAAYFESIEPCIRETYIFPPITEKKNIEISNKIQECISVSIHIRRGDYLEKNRDWALHIDYYKKAVILIRNKMPDAVFFVFSDDSGWAKANLPPCNCVYIDWNKGVDSFRDMQLMSYCRHNIIANSSFSWWGAWLNPNTDKIVIAPDKWFPEMEGTRDIVPSTWIKISSSA